mgnify:CR=1 FL=1|jgi:hypothetical protein
MIISDNETKLDMLNNHSIATTISTIIKENPELPVTIGIHGDWGAGKSSILEMIESDFSEDERFLCVKFNGWKHQGFEDAKMALIETIVSSLVSEKSLSGRFKDKVSSLWKSVNKIKAAKMAGSVAFSLVTGAPPLTLIQEGLKSLGENVQDQGKRDKMIETITANFSDSNQSVSKEFDSFSNTFNELLEASSYDKIVVLIDDLDRCLPNVVIETLEAVRLFMFEKSTVFVVAADEIMVEYAVKEHFPVYEETRASRNFSKRYLEKLIQVPFRIPKLGDLESRNFIMLLLVGSALKNESLFNELINDTLEKNKRPWENNLLTYSDIKGKLRESFDQVQEMVQIGQSISLILAEGSVGNPRQMKRFINTLLLRFEIAKSRGIDSDIDLKILAKLMLAERFFPSVYDEIALSLNSDGSSSVFVEQEEPSIKEESKDEKTNNLEKDDEKSSREFEKWVSIEPDMKKIDLRPYFFISKEKNVWETPILGDLEKIQSLIPMLKDGNELAIASIEEKIIALSAEEKSSIFSILAGDFQNLSSYATKPKMLLGLQKMVKIFPELQPEMIKLLENVPVNEAGTWIVSGWDGIFRGDYLEKYIQLIDDISKNGSQITLTVATAYLQRNGGR